MNLILFKPATFLSFVVISLILSGCGGSKSHSQIDEPTPIINSAPFANAGADQRVFVGELVTLSASGSTDIDGDTLTYFWQLVSAPASSKVSITEPTLMMLTFTPDIDGEYQLSVVVNDGKAASAADVVVINAELAVSDNSNITNQIFTNQSGLCSDYEGRYFSNVTDIKRSADFSGDVVVSVSGNKCFIESNHIPNHDFNDASASFATLVSEQAGTFQIPITPVVLADAQALSIEVTEGILLNGVSLDLLAAACYDVGNEPIGQEKIGCGPSENNHPWRYDPMSPLNTFGTDSHNAHTQPSGKYHYHGNPLAMFSQSCGSDASAVIGFAADGFPIYGSCIKDPQSGAIRKVRASFILKNNGGVREAVTNYSTPKAGVGAIASDNYDGQFRGDWLYQQNAGDLDECNGMTVNGQYGYYITDTFPWAVNCFKGAVDPSFSAGPALLERRLHSHDNKEFHQH